MTLYESIINGEHDEILDVIGDAVRSRRRYLQESKAMQNQAELKSGMHVRITEGISPKYLIGATGFVRDRSEIPHRNFKAGLIPVELDERVRRFHGIVGMPAACLERV